MCLGKGTSEEVAPCIYSFHMLTDQNSQYAQVAYFGVSGPKLLQSCIGVTYSATLLPNNPTYHYLSTTEAYFSLMQSLLWISSSKQPPSLC